MPDKGGNHDNSEAKKAFESMWGLYPAPVCLLRADREILAVNDEMSKLGVQVGSKCFQMNERDRLCEGCQGNAALRESASKRVLGWDAKRKIFSDGYWVPVKGTKDLMVHFGNDITKYVKEELCA